MIKLALRNPYAVAVIALATITLGITAYRKIPAVQIVTFYPGMPPEVMERDIMSRLERWTGQSVGIEHQEAKAMLGVSVVKDFFREGISLDTAMSQVTSYAVSDMFYLPPGTIPPAVYGGKLRRILAYVDRTKLEARGLSPMDVVDALNEQSVFIPAGRSTSRSTASPAPIRSRSCSFPSRS